MAALSDGVGFRNSILAGFATTEYPAEFLVAYLNSTPIRWLHYFRNRDARQGMPQMKIGHLRAIPAPPAPTLVARLAVVGLRQLAKSGGLPSADQEEIDRLVADAFDLTKAERDLQRRWAEALHGPAR